MWSKNQFVSIRPFKDILVDISANNRVLKAVNGINNIKGYLSFIVASMSGDENNDRYHFNHCNGDLYLTNIPQNDLTIFKNDASFIMKRSSGLTAMTFRMTKFLHAVVD